MNKGFSLIEVLVSLILLGVLSTSLFLFLDGYREIRFFEKKRLEAFREAASLIEIKMDYLLLVLRKLFARLFVLGVKWNGVALE
jgi:prepilin-type N-terminal cleavage/methylation domain-containing protein